MEEKLENKIENQFLKNIWIYWTFSLTIWREMGQIFEVKWLRKLDLLRKKVLLQNMPKRDCISAKEWGGKCMSHRHLLTAKNMARRSTGEVLFFLLKRSSGMEELAKELPTLLSRSKFPRKSAILHFTHQKCLNYLPTSKKLKWVPCCQKVEFSEFFAREWA